MKRVKNAKENKELKQGHHLKNDPESSHNELVSLNETDNMNIDTPYYPRTEEHTALLEKARTGEQANRLLLHLQRSYGNAYVQRLVRNSNNQTILTDISSSEKREIEDGRIDEKFARTIDFTQVQRQDIPEEEELQMMRDLRRQEDEEIIPGARMKPLRENVEQQRDSSGRSVSSNHRASPSSSATGNIGDATDLDGQGLYGWNRVTYDTDIATVVNGVIPTQSSEEEMPRIVIFTGTHGTDPGGHLLNDEESREFVNEDQATANAVMAANPGVEVEVIDVVNTFGSKSELTSIYGMTDYIRILGWCFSQRSYGLGNSIKSNWWPAPDNL